MNVTAIIFWILSALAVFSGLMVILSKNPVYSVLWLISLFFAISGHYILLNAQFLAIVNIIVYNGAIMVLFLFVIMMMNLGATADPQKKIWMRFAGVVSGGMLLWILLSVVRSSIDMRGKIAELKTGDIGLVENLGKVLFTQYAVPFEICSVLFLSAMVGAVVIGKKE
ncbi:MAG: NADH-quinone oxidoreductase subunit J [Chitinophagaceae bacterium]|jgi:NADH-quinone oxidoreductase subunit J|nr:NADH-quinone oxidoreductase subunit J [Chitinophagaceae bacterium]